MIKRVPSLTVFNVVDCNPGSDRKRKAEPVPATMALPLMNNPSGVGEGCCVGGSVAVGRAVMVGTIGVGVIVITSGVGRIGFAAVTNGLSPINSPMAINPHRPTPTPMSGPSHHTPPVGRPARARTRRIGWVVVVS